MQFLTTGGDALAARKGFKLVGRDDELRALSAILLRAKASSVILAGPGGVGASAMIHGLQASKADPNSPFDIIAKRIFWLDFDELFSSGDHDEMNKSFQKILSILRRTSDSILVIEDAKDFIETARNQGCSHFINAINACVKAGDTQAIFECKDDDLGYVLKSHADMKECFTILDLSEPAGEALKVIAYAGGEFLTTKHSIRVDPEAIDKAIELTSRYQTRDASLSRAQPDRTTTLIDRALATYRLTAHRRNPKAIELEKNGGDPAEIARLDAEYNRDHEELSRLYNTQRNAEIKVVELEERIENQLKVEAERREAGEEVKKPSAISSFMNNISNSGFDSEEVRRLKDQVKVANGVIEETRTKFQALTDRINADLCLTADMVLAEFAALSGIPVAKLNEDERDKLKNLESNILKNLWGQDHAVKKLSDAIKSSRIGKRNKNKPLASFMFLGPSGTGKTEIVRLLSKEMDMELLRFDMSEYMEKNAVNTLIGAPAGYEGYENGGTLTKAMKKNPRQIVLFDEIEKADPAVFNIFLQMLDAGRLTDRFGQTVSFSEAIIVMTSNIGQPELLEGLEMRDGVATFAIDEDTRHSNALHVLTSTPGIRPEFLNRFNGRQNIVFFNHLEAWVIEKIVWRELKDLDAAYSEQGIRVVVPDEAVKQFVRDHYDVTTGGRGLPGYINANLEPYVTNKILDDQAFTGTMVVGYSGGNFTATFEAEF